MSILHMTLYRKWFDAIAAGHKREEYRAATPYWTSRLSKQYECFVRIVPGLLFHRPTPF